MVCTKYAMVYTDNAIGKDRYNTMREVCRDIMLLKDRTCIASVAIMYGEHLVAIIPLSGLLPHIPAQTPIQEVFIDGKFYFLEYTRFENGKLCVSLTCSCVYFGDDEVQKTIELTEDS